MRMKSLSLVGSFRPTQLYVLAWGKRMSESLLFSTRWIYQSRWRPGLFHWIMENREGYLVMCVTLTVSEWRYDCVLLAPHMPAFFVENKLIMSEYLLLSTLWMYQSRRPEKGVLPIGVSPRLDSLNGSWRTEKGILPCVSLFQNEEQPFFYCFDSFTATFAGILCWESSSDSTLEDKGLAIP